MDSRLENLAFFASGVTPTGVPIVDLPLAGVPGFVAVYPTSLRHAFPVVLGANGSGNGEPELQPVAAAGFIGAGRVVVIAHNGYVTDVSRPLHPFVVHCCAWAARTDAFASSAVGPGSAIVRNKIPDRNRGEVVLLWDGVPFAGLETVSLVRQFVWSGGSAVMGSCPWGWLQLNHDKTIVQHPINEALQGSGMQLVSGYAAATNKATNSFTLIPPDIYSNSAAVKQLCESCCNGHVWLEFKRELLQLCLLHSKVVEPRSAEISPPATPSGALEPIPPDETKVLAVANDEREPAKCCYGREGWWATCIDPLWIEIELSKSAAVVLAGVEVHCVNVEATPKTLRLMIRSESTASWKLVLATPFPTSLGQKPQNQPTFFDLRKVVPVAAERQAVAVRVELHGRHRGHYTGVNSIRFFAERSEVSFRTHSLAALADLCDDDQGLVLSSLKDVASEGVIPGLQEIVSAEGLIACQPWQGVPLALPPHLKALLAGLLRIRRLATSVHADSWFPGRPSKSAVVPHDRAQIGEARIDVSFLAQLRPNELGWISTHTYAVAGTPVTCSFASTAPGFLIDPQLFAVRVGCHSDDLTTQEKWSRWPVVCEQYPLHTLVCQRAARSSTGTTAAASFQFTFTPRYNGPIFLVPLRPLNTMPPMAPTQLVLAVLRGATPAPTARLAPERVVSGLGANVDDDDLWAPWGEIEGRLISIHIPRAAMLKRSAEELLEAAAFWDEVVESHHRVAAPPYGRRRERIVCDVQLSCGYMHSGYPIGAHLDFADHCLDVASLRKKGSWGAFHELGHNMQKPAWTWTSAVEVTCNIFTLYTMERVCGLSRHDHDWFFGGNRLKALTTKTEQLRTADRSRLSSDYALALQMFIDVIDQFGWDALIECFHSYEREVPDPVGSSWTDAQKVDNFAIRLSRACRSNCGGLLRCWGLPVSDGALQVLQNDKSLAVVAIPLF